MIKIFISSTFVDMHAERDAIQLQILPEIRKTVEQLGEGFDFCDLRWGINTYDMDEKDRMGKILEVCFQEIGKCSESECETFMIVLLGERYGSSPDKDRLDDVLLHMNANKKGHIFTKEEIKGKSYTHLEISYGPFLNDEQFRRTIFMFRKPIVGAPEKYHGDNNDAENLNKLKKIICDKKEKLHLDNVIEYTLEWVNENGEGKIEGIDLFVTLLKEKLLKTIEPSLDKMVQLSDEERAVRRHWMYIHKKANCFIGMDELLKECNLKLVKPNGNLILYGPAGMGKSCLLCKLVEMKNDTGANVYPYICSNLGGKVSKTDIYLEWIAYLKKILNSKSCSLLEIKSIKDEGEKCKEAFNMVCRLLAEYDNSPLMPQLYLFVDGVDCVSRAGEVGHNIYLIPHIYTKIKFIYSYRYEENIFCSDKRTDYIAVTSQNNNAETMMRANVTTLGKELPSIIVDLIVQKHNDKSPKYLNLLLKRFSLLNAEDFANGTSVDNLIIKLTEIIKTAPNSEELLERELIEIVSQRTDQVQIKAIISFLASSEDGLRLSDLQMLVVNEDIPWSNVNLSILINYLDETFDESESGLIDFSDKQFKVSVAKDIDTAYYRMKIYKHLRGLPAEDHFRASNIFAYCCHIGDKEYALDLIQSQYTFNDAFIRQLVVSDYNYLRWLLAIMQCGKQYGMTGKAIWFIIHRLWDNPIPGAYSMMHDFYELAVKFCQQFAEEVSLIDADLAQARLAYYSQDYGYNGLEEYEKAIKQFKKHNDDCTTDIIEFIETYHGFVHNLINNKLYDSAEVYLDEMYELITSNLEKGRLIKPRAVEFLLAYAKLYEKLKEASLKSEETFETVQLSTAKVYLTCLNLLATEANDISLKSFANRYPDIFERVVRPVYLVHLESDELMTEAVKNVSVMEKIAGKVDEANVYSALSLACKNYAVAFEYGGLNEMAVKFAERAYDLCCRLEQGGLNPQYDLQKSIEIIAELGHVYYSAEMFKDSAEIYEKGVEKIIEYLNKYGQPPYMVFNIYLSLMRHDTGLVEAYTRCGKYDVAHSKLEDAFYYFTQYEGDDPDVMEGFLERTLDTLPQIWKGEQIKGSQIIKDVSDVITTCNSKWVARSRIFNYNIPDYRYRALVKIGEAAAICSDKGDFESEIELRKLHLTETEKYYKSSNNMYAFKEEEVELNYNLALAYEHSGNISEAHKTLKTYLNKIAKFCKSISHWENKHIAISCYELLARTIEKSDPDQAKKYYCKALKTVDRDVYAYGENYMFINCFSCYLKSPESIVNDCADTLNSFESYSTYGQRVACRELASNYITLGKIFQQKGDYENAFKYYHNALDCCLDAHDACGDTLDKWLLGMATNAIAVIMELNRDPKAFQYFDEADYFFNQVHYIVKDDKREPTVVGMDERMRTLLNRAFSSYPTDSYDEEFRKEDFAKALEYAKELQLKTGLKQYKKIIEFINSRI